MAMPNVREAAAPAPAGRIGRFRWTICGLLFLAATINYIDRQVIGILKPTLQAQFGWSEIDYSDIVFAFQLAYAIGFIFAGSIVDRLGIKRGFALALVIWSFASAKFLTDPIWWMYLFWLPDFFSRNYGLSLLQLGPPIIVIYLMADIGSVGGGWLSSTLIRRGWTVNAARKTAMLVCALAVVPIVAAAHVQSMWSAVALVSLATAAHQGWSANLFTLASDMFPRRAVGSVVGLGGMAGAVGGMLIAKVTGYILQMTGSYTVVLMIAGVAYLVALAVVQILTPNLEPARVD